MLRAFTASVFLMVVAITGVMHPASADVPIVSDSRIKTLVYNENEVYTVTTHYGYQANIEFGNNENVEAVSVGDRVGWQIVPAGRRLFIRAMEENSHTNMTIITNKRAYQFDLRSSSSNAVFGSEELTYVLRFYYPDASGAVPNYYTNAPPVMAPAAMPSAAPQAPPRGLPSPLPELPGSRYGAPSYGGSLSPNLPAPLPSSSPFAAASAPTSGVVEPPAPVAVAPISPLQPIATPGASRFAAAPANNSTAPAVTSKPAPVSQPAISEASAPPQPAPRPTSTALADPARIESPAASTAELTSTPSYNYRYTYSGSDAAAPLKIFDDGKATYFKFASPPSGTTFTVVDDLGSERIVPYTVNAEGLAVIPAVGKRVKLNQGGAAVTVYNEAMG